MRRDHGYWRDIALLNQSAFVLKILRLMRFVIDQTAGHPERDRRRFVSFPGSMKGPNEPRLHAPSEKDLDESGPA